jgi:hypothetical protein
MLSFQEIKNEIIHYICLLNECKIKYISDEKIKEIREFLDKIPPIVNNGIELIENIHEIATDAIDIVTEDQVFGIPERLINEIPEIKITKNEIIEKPDIPDYTMKLALFRKKCESLDVIGNNIIYNGKSYLFDNIFENIEHNNDHVLESLNFINQRIESEKESAIITYGYSNSGKSYFITQLIKLFDKSITNIKLYEIYLNQIFVFHQNKKKILEKNETVTDDKYLFSTSIENLINIIEKFKRIKSNGINNYSSRSHTIVELYFKNKYNTKSICVKLVDVCGNEKVAFIPKKGLFDKKNEEEKQLEKESVYINRSLFSLSQYIKNNKYKNNTCKLFNVLKNCKNIVFILFFHDMHTQYLNLYSKNHLLIFKDLYEQKKI